MDISGLPARLDDLIDYTKNQHPDGGPLEHLSDSVLVAEQVGEVADHLVGHFVDQARRAGASWTEIGQAMGVSKQAAQKRFVPKAAESRGASEYERFTDRARRVVEHAQVAARLGGREHVGSEQLVLGLISESEGFAARAIQAQGASLDDLRAAAGGAIGGAESGESPAGAGEVLPFGADARKALQLSLREALHLGHNYVGTEHILLGVLRDEKAAGAMLLTDAGVSREDAEAWIRAALEGYRHGRRVS
jgi:hypothetical protein